MLKGAEVKSLRHGRATLTEAFAQERDGELYLLNCYIPEYQGGVLSRFEPRAPRKLLLKRKQIDVLIGATTRDGPSASRSTSHSTSAAWPRCCWASARAARNPTSATPSPPATGNATRPG